VAYTTEGITRVRLRPLTLDVVGGRPATSAGAVEVTWQSTQSGRCHQVYVNGQRAGVTLKPEDRRLIVSVPVGQSGTPKSLLVEVVAVDAADRRTDFGGELSGFGSGIATRVQLSWQAGSYLDDALESFDVFADGRTGTVDYTSPLNPTPIPAAPGGMLPWGYGCGGYGTGGYGRSAARYQWTSDVLEPGAWRFAVVARDAAGNRLATAAEIAVTVSPLPRPPHEFRLKAYDPVTRVATLAWQPSPDV